ncbi:hypothetical protein M440DRAFT_1457981 [Trichoderma longibrachiatum ATCC 18648]|uniref:Pre-rRNA-processing protein RIX1 n=1 Tax=Trichoderma longibrachiatum ATCC 18648 TaxID=983965 RepID=A0A2T4C2F9_TRILO|nr:hypothetical protein M440DRAFT_1457981 [Trichoderma longibrachiatum ATCC 18648]
MSSSASTTDLRVLNRKLTSLPPAQLPHSLPSLIRHVLRCRDALSAPQDPKLKGDASQTSMLVHKLKTSITTHLNGRSREGRFAAIGLIKAAVDVGGWETLRGSEAWVRGLVSIVQKGDPAASKELAVVTLTKIFMLVHPYQTLVREVATPFLPAFGTACLQLIKSKAEAQSPSAPLTLVETICSSFSTLIPLYPPTFRPFSSQIRTAVGVYLAPTCSDEISVPVSLQRAARRLMASIHFVAAKSSGSEEWAKLVDGIIQEFHTTADQVLRAVDESPQALLAAILAQLPQSHLKPALRGHLDKTAILTRSRDAMLASVLNPYRDQHGRMYPSILPHLVQQFPHDQGLEVLRSNLRTSGVQGAGSEMFASLSEVAELQQIDEEQEEEEAKQEEEKENKADEEMQDSSSEKAAAEAATSSSGTKVDLPVQTTVTAPNPFEPRASNSAERAASPPKRKHEGSGVPMNSKRQELEKSEPAAAPASVTTLQADGVAKGAEQQEESDSDDDGSVHLNMELDDDEEEDEEDE